MAYQEQPLGHRVRWEPKKAKAEILAALEKSGGAVTLAAFALGVGLRSLHRWIGKLGLVKQLHVIKRRHGQPPTGRRAKAA